MVGSVKEMIPLQVFALFFLLVTSKEMNPEPECRELSCSRHGPSVRFPFRLKGIHPDHCGYQTGFDLSCSPTDETLLQLPAAMNLSVLKIANLSDMKIVNLSVMKIDYQSQRIHLYDPTGNLINGLQFLNLTNSPFHFESGLLSFRNYSFFNCSTYIDTWKLDFLFDYPGYRIVALNSSRSIDDSPSLFSCSMMYNLYSIPKVLESKNNDIQLNWMDTPKLECRNCGEEGMMCGWNWNMTNPHPQTLCLPKHRHRGPSRGQLVTGVVLSFSLVAIVVAAIYEAYTSDKLDKENQRRIKKFLEDYKALKPTRYSYADIKRITNQFKEELGQGAYGTVYKGKLSNEIEVAVKLLTQTKGNGEEFINEVGTMAKIHHINVVRLVGFCADGFRRALVYEFLPNGSLKNFIASAGSERNFLGWEKIERIAIGIAKGIEYLHQGCDQRILHFDIKPHNILLDHNFNPKICDFGLAKLCSKDQSAVSMTTARGTIGYIAPEVFSRNFGNVSYKSDVYSFGMLLLEMVGGRKNTDGKDEAYYPEWIYNILEDREDFRIQIEGKEDSEIAKKLAIVGLWCIQWHPVDRPSMEMVVQMLEGEGDNLSVPPNCFEFTGIRGTNGSLPEKRRHRQDLEAISEVHQEIEEISD